MRLAIDQGLTQLVTNFTRSRLNTQSSLLDLVFTNSKDLFNHVSYKPPLGESDHLTLIIELVLEVNFQTTTQKYLYKWADYSAIGEDLISSYTANDTSSVEDDVSTSD